MSLFTAPAVACPLVTPFAPDETVDVEALSAHADRLVEAGLDGLVPCGTSGEFASLTDAEYRTVVETVVDAADGRVPVVAGAGDTTVAGARARVDIADAVGADAVLVPTAYYHGANAPAGDTRFLERVADASPLPVYLYNIRATVGHRLDRETVRALTEHENVVGVKDSDGDFSEFAALVDETPDDFQVLQGYDTLFASSVLAGADGGINALSNVVPEAFVALCDALDAGDVERARASQSRIRPLFERVVAAGFAPGVKAALVARGWLDDDVVRPPLVTMEDPTRERIATAVADVTDERWV